MSCWPSTGVARGLSIARGCRSRFPCGVRGRKVLRAPVAPPARVFSNPVVEIKEVKVAPLICCEQLLVWPVLHSMVNRPDLIVLIGNGWWTVGSSIVAIQKANATAWAKLFGIPAISAFNL